ncbi:MAG TPA: hypothetical protein PKC48_11365, partial [Sphingorhabdus sp.]|nr:hypothetical protein [Sphingorhabdus sp.]
SRGELPQDWRQVNGLPPARLIEAVAVSIPTHCVDGWSFAARALSALLAGDAHGCRHMAYYAQLRAGLCIMANLGVGLFNCINFAVDGTGAIVRIDPARRNNSRKGLGTHSAVWSALDTWSRDAAGSRLFLDLVKIRHVKLYDALEAVWPGFISVGTVGALIQAWGVDLQRGLVDRNFRNTSSYAAHALNQLPMRTASNLRFIEAAWRLFEPSGGGGFDSLDRYLVRKILNGQHEIMNPGAPLAGSKLDTRYAQLPGALRSMCSQDFILGNVEKVEPEIIRLADVRASPASPLHMLARALLLLRTAMAFTHSSLTEAGIDTAAGDLRSWLESLANSRGFCGAATPLGDGSGLWDDISMAIEDLERSRKPAPIDLMAWKMNHASNGMPFISEAERIAVWSFCA